MWYHQPMEFLKIQEMLAGEPKYRMSQVKQAVFVDLVEDWGGVTGLPKVLRERLQEKCPLEITAEVSVSNKEDTVKALLTMQDGQAIETVLMRHDDGRNTVCVSTQAGCPMGCAFCATGKMGLVRSLSSDEIISQVLFFARYLKKEGERMGSVVFMGMGEPFLNYDNVMSAIRLMHDKEVFNIGARHFSISTCCILDGIKKLAQEDLDINLAISLHASNDEVRKKIMPIARAHSLKELFQEVDAYISAKNRKVMFEYLMISGVNDSDEQVEELAKIMRKKLYVVNLIAYNDTGEFTASSQKRMAEFRDILEDRGVEVSIRHRFGRDIKGACGQLATERKAR
jgi:23S rRNA (adenine2503-C2)-methyltransferase